MHNCEYIPPAPLRKKFRRKNPQKAQYAKGTCRLIDWFPEKEAPTYQVVYGDFLITHPKPNQQ